MAGRKEESLRRQSEMLRRSSLFSLSMGSELSAFDENTSFGVNNITTATAKGESPHSPDSLLDLSLEDDPNTSWNMDNNLSNVDAIRLGLMSSYMNSQHIVNSGESSSTYPPLETPFPFQDYPLHFLDGSSNANQLHQNYSLSAAASFLANPFHQPISESSFQTGQRKRKLSVKLNAPSKRITGGGPSSNAFLSPNSNTSNPLSYMGTTHELSSNSMNNNSAAMMNSLLNHSAARNAIPEKVKTENTVHTNNAPFSAPNDKTGENSSSDTSQLASPPKRQKAKRSKESSSRFRGVSKCSKDGRFQARIRVGNNVKYLGRFRSEEEAARRYDSAAASMHGKRAQFNFPRYATST
mmetsp:Transcript_5047/g.9007  ORF Transcript_5047/g.9007 Transcript_5047/m.9007 type:complete len:353 (+) Transcript_5047:603-1661(+)